MIVIVEGPRCVGKTLFVETLYKELRHRKIAANIWKVSRGVDPVSDMLNSLENFTEDQVWILDRFHLTEWTNSFVLRRGWTLIDEWVEIENGLVEIDEELKKQGSLVVFLTVRASTLEERWQETNREDIVTDPDDVLWMWGEIFNLTKCDIIHFVNNTERMLIRNVDVTADLIKGRAK